MREVKKRLWLLPVLVLFPLAILFIYTSLTGRADDNKKILYMPLDDRPVNYSQITSFYNFPGIELVYPAPGELGAPGELARWLEKSAAETKAAVISIDMLVYGGLVASRQHHGDEALFARLETLKKAGINQPVYAFVSVMRTPAENTPLTMPDYYEKYGALIHKYGVLRDKIESGLAEPGDIQKLQKLRELIPQEHLKDFISRREINHRVTMRALDLVQQGYIDFLIICKDDTAPYGFTRIEAGKLESKVRALGIEDKVLFLTGTDECGALLLAAATCEINRYRPGVYVDYAYPDGASMIYPYEDVPLSENIARHIEAAGASLTLDAGESDLVLAVNNLPPKENTGAEAGQGYVGLAQRIKKYMEEGKPVAVADIKHPNGGDPAFLEALNPRVNLSTLAGYAGWNTAGNSIGLALAQGLNYNALAANNNREFLKKHRELLLTRLIEDWGYQAVVRPGMKTVVPADQWVLFTNRGLENKVTSQIEARLNDFASSNLAEDFGPVKITNVTLPWHRVFDVQFEISE